MVTSYPHHLSSVNKEVEIVYGKKVKVPKKFPNPEKTIERIHREKEKEKQKPALQNMEDCSKLALK